MRIVACCMRCVVWHAAGCKSCAIWHAAPCGSLRHVSPPLLCGMWLLRRLRSVMWCDSCRCCSRGRSLESDPHVGSIAAVHSASRFGRVSFDTHLACRQRFCFCAPSSSHDGSTCASAANRRRLCGGGKVCIPRLDRCECAPVARSTRRRWKRVGLLGRRRMGGRCTSAPTCARALADRPYRSSRKAALRFLWIACQLLRVCRSRKALSAVTPYRLQASW